MNDVTSDKCHLTILLSSTKWSGAIIATSHILMTFLEGGIVMSNRERLLELANHVPDYKIKYAIAYLQGLTVDEDEDDALCEEMLQAYKEIGRASCRERV